MTELYPANAPQAIAKAVEALDAGELIVIPTDTVYGLACRIQDDAILRLFAAKERPQEKSLPVLLSSAVHIAKVATIPYSTINQLIEHFWPGPLTLVLPKIPDLPSNLSLLPTIGVRVPDHDIARKIIEAAGGVLAVSSANKSGQPAAYLIKDALDQLGDEVAVAIDGGRTPGHSASTVAQIEHDQVTILRAGPITKAQLEAAIKQP